MKLGQGWCLYSRFVEELSALDQLILPQNLADTCINRRELFKGAYLTLVRPSASLAYLVYLST